MTPSQTKSSQTFREFIAQVRPDFEFHKHCEVIADNLQRVTDGELLRLLVLMPPVKYGASELVSRLFPAYYLSRHPANHVALATYEQAVAVEHSQIALRHLKQMAPDVSGTIHSFSAFANIGGRGFSLGIIDAPVKNTIATDPAILKRQQDWYSQVFSTREEPGAAQVVVMPRWDEQDLAGYLLWLEDNDEWPQEWHIVHLPALKESPELEPIFPASCTVEADWREPGEALCPKIHDVAALQLMRRRVGKRWWQALFQQNPLKNPAPVDTTA
jgi:hypothetical protein